MADTVLANLLRSQRGQLALIVGNGVHRYRSIGDSTSWEALLAEVAHASGMLVTAIPKGTTATEFYDVVALRGNESDSALQSRFCQPMSRWDPRPHHVQIMAWAQRHAAPVLTTNFDEVLSKAVNCTFQRPEGRPFTDYYPWDCHFGAGPLADPCGGFGIWHINGMARYKRSIRLGLSHYMASVARTRGWMHSGGSERLFDQKDQRRWPGAGTWLHVVFNKPLMIFGLALNENEVFLRWLFIQRAKYFKKFPDRKQGAWYVYKDEPADPLQAGRIFFLQAMGVICVPASTYDEIYAHKGWAS